MPCPAGVGALGRRGGIRIARRTLLLVECAVGAGRNGSFEHERFGMGAFRSGRGKARRARIRRARMAVALPSARTPCGEGTRSACRPAARPDEDAPAAPERLPVGHMSGGASFDQAFAALTGHPPFGWQRRLYAEHFARGEVPAALMFLGRNNVV